MNPRRFLLFAAVLIIGLPVAGCASKPKEPYSAPKRTRDYSSVNKESTRFVFETFAKERSFRREHNRRVWDWSEMRTDNARIQKESLAFFWDALKAGEAESWKAAWTEELPWLLKPVEPFGESVRFGLLDSGD